MTNFLNTISQFLFLFLFASFATIFIRSGTLTLFLCFWYDGGMRLNSGQIRILSGYFSDVSKILVGSAVVGFFVPIGTGQITLPIFIGGTIAAFICLLLGIKFAE